jgi:hypothetical protein
MAVKSIISVMAGNNNRLDLSTLYKIKEHPLFVLLRQFRLIDEVMLRNNLIKAEYNTLRANQSSADAIFTLSLRYNLSEDHLKRIVFKKPLRKMSPPIVLN